MFYSRYYIVMSLFTIISFVLLTVTIFNIFIVLCFTLSNVLFQKDVYNFIKLSTMCYNVLVCKYVNVQIHSQKIQVSEVHLFDNIGLLSVTHLKVSIRTLLQDVNYIESLSVRMFLLTTIKILLQSREFDNRRLLELGTTSVCLESCLTLESLSNKFHPKVHHTHIEKKT